MDLPQDQRDTQLQKTCFSSTFLLMGVPCCTELLLLNWEAIREQRHYLSAFSPLWLAPLEFLQLTGDHLSEEFGNVNSVHKVPALKDGDFTMAESTAILLYLARKFKTADHWYPSDLQKRARVDEYLAWQHTNTRLHGSNVFLVTIVTPIILGHECDPVTLSPLLTELQTSMTYIEEKFLQDKPFIAGEEISFADLVAIVEIMQAVASGVDVFEEKPNLGAWKQRVVEALGEDLFKEAHNDLLNPKDKAQMSIAPEIMESLKVRLHRLSH
ncbi:glutathione S-transferase theta-1-like [Bombina bombina]|uniref:glutathione S-transferase theta-1-like n=1 Tax=Bombina bombina TaxID=8345 RepID=UPI00235A4D15|nr:glutathione S-transferase theta-1-like [Bombina bombina]